MILVYARSIVLPDARDLASAARASRADGFAVSEPQLLDALTIGHGLPALLDLMADARFADAQESVGLADLEVDRPPPGRQRVRVLAFHRPGGDRVEVRFLDDADRTVARVRARLSRAVAGGASDVLIRRFSHGGKGPLGERGST